MLKFFRPSGGLMYHWRAWRQGRHWLDFSDSLARWLESWQVPSPHLILIGPSAGYNLPRSWLAKFQRIEAYDVDPLAARLFARRHPQVSVTFIKQDMFWINGKLSTAALERALKRYPEASVLFCNVLGQVPLEGKLSAPEWESYLISLSYTLRDRRWASFHDTLTVQPLSASHHAAVHRAMVNSGNIKATLQSLACPADLEVIDHGLSGPWHGQRETQLLRWTLTPQSLHLIECVRN